MQRNRCFICCVPFQNSKENFERYGNCCVSCDRFATIVSRITHKSYKSYWVDKWTSAILRTQNIVIKNALLNT